MNIFDILESTSLLCVQQSSNGTCKAYRDGDRYRFFALNGAKHDISADEHITSAARFDAHFDAFVEANGDVNERQQVQAMREARQRQDDIVRSFKRASRLANTRRIALNHMRVSGTMLID